MLDSWNDLGAGFHPASAADFIPREKLRELQTRRLLATVKHAHDNVALFRDRMASMDVSLDSIRSLDDLARLPFTEKSDLRNTYPYGLFATPMREIVRLHASSGTTGRPIVVAYTQDDINVWASAVARCFAACGVHRGDIVQNAYGYGLFTGGLGAHYGAESLGATVVPSSGGATDRQIMLLKDFGVTVVCCTPSYFLHLLDRAGELGVNVKELPLRVGIFGAEPWTDNMRRRIEAESNIVANDIYGLSEIIGPGVGIECHAHAGLHLLEDHFFPEIVDPSTGRVLPDGEEGELVLTTLSKRAMPMIRYRTRDISALDASPCACGRTIRRMRRIARRTDDMLIIRGVNVFPSQIEAGILAVEGTLPHYQIVLTRQRGLDHIEVCVEVNEQIFSDKVKALEQLRAKIAQALENVLGLRVEVRLVAPHTLQRSEGKAKRVVDKRDVES